MSSDLYNEFEDRYYEAPQGTQTFYCRNVEKTKCNICVFKAWPDIPGYLMKCDICKKFNCGDCVIDCFFCKKVLCNKCNDNNGNNKNKKISPQPCRGYACGRDECEQGLLDCPNINACETCNSEVISSFK